MKLLKWALKEHIYVKTNAYLCLNTVRLVPYSKCLTHTNLTHTDIVYFKSMINTCSRIIKAYEHQSLKGHGK